MTALADKLRVSARFARSANLERDVTNTEPLDGYVVTARAIDIVERLAGTATKSDAGGAWSITGPYGSGKSSLAVLLDGAFGEAGQVRDKALDLIADAAPEVAAVVNQAHAAHGTQARGFHRAVVTASREPISYTLVRALHSAVIRHFGKIPPNSKFKASTTLKAALADAEDGDPRRTGPSPAALLDVARCLAEQAPLLIVIDEFGKNLEAIAHSTATDPYLLQQLAEAGQGAGLPIFTLTLQHLSFEDYFTGTDSPEQREWAKVQGRFEDIPYVDSPAQTRALIGTVFDPLPALAKRVTKWSEQAAPAMAKVGIEDLTDPTVIANCYPLHPIAAAVLPELCGRYGQNERTLFSFLTSQDPAAVPSFLAKTTLDSKSQPPVVGLAEIYDYFVAGGVLAGSPGAQASRWTEIATRLRDTHGLTDRQSDLAKAVAVLNLVSSSGTLRASRQLLGLLQAKPTQTLASLEKLGLLTYRDFADEYRIWQGSDVDLRTVIERASTGIAKLPLVDVLRRVNQPTPVIAARHSAEHDVLRVFSRRYANGDETLDPMSPFEEADGEVLLVVGTERRCPEAVETGLTKPRVVAIPNTITELDTAARSVAAIRATLELPEVADDWVARSELGEQLAQAEALLDASLVETFASENCDWSLLSDDGPHKLGAGRGSAALSEAADLAYPLTPIIGNEMINRTDVTSQGAKARRIVLEGMIERSDLPDLGFEGYGPEVAMYRSVLGRSQIHRNDDRNGVLTFAAPQEPSLIPAWKALEKEFKRARTRRVNLNDIYAVLLSPPIGMKAAVLPVFVTAALLAHADEVAIYEHGTFRPVLGSDVSERMVRNPGHFDIKHFANASGARRDVVDALAQKLSVAKRFRKHRVSNVLAIVGHLVSAVSQLDNFTLGTASMSDKTLRARDVIVTAVEPDELLFELLPEALGFPPVKATKSYPKKDLLARAVKVAIDELQNCSTNLLRDLYDELMETAGESSRLAVTGQAAALDGKVLDPDARPFVLTMANDGVASDTDWIKAIATVVTKRAVAEWSDEDRSRYSFEIREQVAAFRRLLALHVEHHAHEGEPFQALRVTFTRPDGREDHRVAILDENTRTAAANALNVALGKLEKTLGSETRAQQTLLALLGEQILPPVPSTSENEVTNLTTKKKTKHG